MLSGFQKLKTVQTNKLIMNLTNTKRILNHRCYLNKYLNCCTCSNKSGGKKAHGTMHSILVMCMGRRMKNYQATL